MHHPQEPPAQPQARPIRDSLYGAIPATIGTVLVLLHLRAPIVPPGHQSVLMNAWLGLVCTTLAYWLYRALRAVADRICDKFDARHAELAEQFARTRRSQARICKRLEAIEHRLEAIERQGSALGGITDEIKHLRKLILDDPGWGRPSLS